MKRDYQKDGQLVREYSPENVTITIGGHEIQGFMDGKPFDEVAEPLESRGMIGRTVLICGDFSSIEARMLARLANKGRSFDVIHVGTNTQSPDANNEQALADMRKISEVMSARGMRFWDSFCELPQPMVYERVKLPHTQRHGPRDKWGKLK